MQEANRNLSQKFKRILDELQGQSYYLNPNWNKNAEIILKDFDPYPPFNFLRHRVILYTMFVIKGGFWMDEQLKLLESKFDSNFLKEILRENSFGQPVILSQKYSTSHNSIHNLYHLAKYEKLTGNKLSDFESVVEWGGGYGNLARIYWSLMGEKVTYILVDMPIFAALQWYYLSHIFGEENVNLVNLTNKDIKKNRFNIVSLPYINKLKISCDLFISTWGLSESPKETQDFCFSSNLFGAKNFLFAYQNSNMYFPYAQRLEEYAINAGGKIEEIEFIPGKLKNYYAVK